MQPNATAFSNALGSDNNSVPTSTVAEAIDEGTGSAQKQNLKSAIRMADHTLGSAGRIVRYSVPGTKFLFFFSNYIERNASPQFQSAPSGQRAACAGVGAVTQFGAGVVGDAVLWAPAIAIGSTGTPGFIVATSLLSAGLPLVDMGSEWVGDKTQQACHKTFDFFNPSTDSVIQQKQKAVADIVEAQLRYPDQAAIKDLDRQLRGILGEKESELVNHVKKQVSHLREFPQQAKKFEQIAKDYKQDQKQNSVNAFEKKQDQTFANFAETSFNAGQLCVALGSLTGKPGLAKAGQGIMAVAGIAGSVSTILATGMALNPVLGVVSGVLMLSGLFKSDKNNMASALDDLKQAILQPLYAMWSDIRNELKLMRAELYMVMDLLRSLTDRVDVQHEIVMARFDHLNRSVDDAKQVLNSGMKDIHLEDLYKICTDIKELLKNNISLDRERLQKLRRRLYHWVQFEGGLCRSLQTGMHEKTLDFKTDAGFEGVKNVIANPADSQSLIGFLAKTAEVLVPAKWQTINKNALPSPKQWNEFTKLYVLLSNHFFNTFNENNTDQLKSIAQTAKNIWQFIRLVQTTPELFAALFKGYEDARTDLERMAELAVAEENKKVVEAMPKDSKDEKLTVDIGNDIKTIINGFAGKMPLNHSIVFQQPNSGYKSSITHGYDYESMRSDAFEKAMTPEIIALIRLGLSPLAINVTPYTDGQVFWMNTAVIIDNKTEYVLNLDYCVGKDLSVDKIYHALEPFKAMNNAWGKVKGTEPIIKVSRAQELQALVTKKIIGHLQPHRLQIKQKINTHTPWQTAFNKLDAYLKLLKAYAHLAGFRDAELQLLNSLSDSEQVKTKLHACFSDEKMQTASPHKDLVPELKAVKTSIMSKVRDKVEDKDLDYFESPDQQSLQATLFALEMLAQRGQQKAFIPDSKLTLIEEKIDLVQHDKENDELTKMLANPADYPPRLLHEKMQMFLKNAKIVSNQCQQFKEKQTSNPSVVRETKATDTKADAVAVVSASQESPGKQESLGGPFLMVSAPTTPQNRA